MVNQIKDFKTTYISDTSGTVISPMQMIGGTVSILGNTSTIPVSGAVTLSGSGSTVQAQTPTNQTGTIPITFAATSTLGASVSWATGSTVNVSFAATSTLQSLYAGVGYTPVHRQQVVNVVTGTIIWTATSGKYLILTDLILSSSTANTVTITVDTSTVGPFYFASWGGAVSNFRTPVVAASTNTSLRLTTTAGTTSITCEGYET